jgi:hypothetical protein
VETTAPPQSAAPEPTPSLSIGARTVAIFARPTQAWGGLERRGQWWFPLIVSILLAVAGTALIHERAIVPTQLAQIERQVDAGQIPPEAVGRIEEQVASPMALGFTLVSVVLAVPLMTLAFALVPWLAAGFTLGHRFRYRDAFVTTVWAGLVAIPGQLLTYVLAWVNESMAGVHTGFGVLLPVEDPPSKLVVGLGTFLDQGIGPLALWYVVVLALGAAALSGGNRGAVIRAVGGIWLVVWAVVSVVAALLAPGA